VFALADDVSFAQHFEMAGHSGRRKIKAVMDCPSWLFTVCQQRFDNPKACWVTEGCECVCQRGHYHFHILLINVLVK
jgi:hypothetical protein